MISVLLPISVQYKLSVSPTSLSAASNFDCGLHLLQRHETFGLKTTLLRYSQLKDIAADHKLLQATVDCIIHVPFTVMLSMAACSALFAH